MDNFFGGRGQPFKSPLALYVPDFNIALILQSSMPPPFHHFHVIPDCMSDLIDFRSIFTIQICAFCLDKGGDPPKARLIQSYHLTYELALAFFHVLLYSNFLLHIFTIIVIF